MADPVVHITNGVPDGGTGNITTLGQTLLDGANVTIGAKADAANTATDTTAVSAVSIWKQISKSAQAIATSLAGTLTVATHAVTQSGNWVLAAGSALIGKVEITDGTNTPAVKAASTAPAATDPALVVAISPNSVNQNGRNTPGNSAPVVMASQAYNTVAASQAAQALTGGSGGAAGDWLDFLLIIPATTAAGAVSITDGTGSAITVWAGGGTTSLTSLIPFTVPVRANSSSGAWKVTTGANVSVIASGNFH